MKNPLILWRETYGLTRERAAQALGVSYSHLAHLERDYHENLSGRILTALARLGVPRREFQALWDNYITTRRHEAVAAATGLEAIR